MPDTVAAAPSHRKHGMINDFHFLARCFRIVCGNSTVHRRIPLILDDPSAGEGLHPTHPAQPGTRVSHGRAAKRLGLRRCAQRSGTKGLGTRRVV